MIDLKRVRAVVLDVAGAKKSYDRQHDVTEFIWHLLERHYHTFVFSSDPSETLAEEDFSHRRLTFIREEMPPGKALLAAHPALADRNTVWITDDTTLQRWLHDNRSSFFHLKPSRKDLPGGQYLPHLSELTTLLNPTGLVLQDISAMIADLRRFRPQGALLVGLGGPTRSGFQQFAVDLRRVLQDEGHELVELMDLSSLLQPPEALLKQGSAATGPWRSPAVAAWVQEALLGPLRAGQTVYMEALPKALPKEFEAHFPLYISEASVLLVFAEMLFTPEVLKALDLSILLEVSPEETTRRLYEIPPEERFDPKFVEQYMGREGKVYQAYMQRNNVRAQAGLRIDANRPEAFHLLELPSEKLV